MPCYITESDESNVPAYNIWTSGNLQSPHVLKSILYPKDSVVADDLHKIDSTSSQKRKLLESERESVEERLHKIQRRKQLQKAAVRASLVVENDSDDSDEEEMMYEQMDWIEKQTLASYNSGSDNDLLFEEKDNVPVVFMPRSKWKDERRLLLRISMAKIYDVEDPEAYLRRSVLINNTVRRLQNDIPINHRSFSTATSTPYAQGNVSYQHDSMDSWDSNVVSSQENDSDTFAFSFQYESLQNSRADDVNSPVVYRDMPCSLNFHLACASLSTDKITLEALQHQILQNGSAFYDRNSLENQTLSDSSLSLVLKQPSTSHSFPSQTCSLEYHNPIQVEERCEYSESSSSIIDSVVYRSLIQSLET